MDLSTVISSSLPTDLFNTTMGYGSIIWEVTTPTLFPNHYADHSIWEAMGRIMGLGTPHSVSLPSGQMALVAWQENPNPNTFKILTT